MMGIGLLLMWFLSPSDFQSPSGRFESLMRELLSFICLNGSLASGGLIGLECAFFLVWLCDLMAKFWLP